MKNNNTYQLIDIHLRDYLEGDGEVIEGVDPVSFMTSNRFDLGFKLFYIEMQSKEGAFAREMYREHIRAFSLGTFTELGQMHKNNLEDYIDSFHNTLKDVELNGFDAKKTLIPLSINGSIINGAHRISSAIYMRKNVACVRLNLPCPRYDYKFFYERKVSEKFLDAAANKFIEYADNVYVAFIWPSAKGRDDQLANVFSNIVYRKDVKLTYTGAYNLLSQLYCQELWLGRPENNYSGVRAKLIECFKTFEPVKVIAFRSETHADVIALKERVRRMFNLGKHSIHITDTKEEAIKAGRLVFNRNSLHFLNYAQPIRSQSFETQLLKIKQLIRYNDTIQQHIAFDSGIVLSLYGLRKASDIDYFLADGVNIVMVERGFESHAQELVYHGVGKDDLIYDPDLYFYYEGIKFISFDQLYKMKRVRRGVKDLIDCELMDALIEENRYKKFKSICMQNIYYLQVLLKVKCISLLRWAGLLGLAKKVYNFLHK